MNEMIMRMQSMSKVVAEALPINLERGLYDKFRSNTINLLVDNLQVCICACRSEEADFAEYLKNARGWRSKANDLDSLDTGLGVTLGDVLSQSGYLFNHTPHLKEIEYIQICRNSPDFLNPLSAISYNLFLGDQPDKDLPTKFDKRLAKDVEAILALLENPQKGIVAAEKMWDRRKNANMHRWYGTGPAHDYLLDPLILCILKYYKADFESDSIHVKGYRFLVKNGF